ncbi:UNVERIFIED_CONTAM: hypothetical protein GTU68_033221 [Idotea baltica]|nr:hypothetical protein [Idotea baltica]
MSISSGLARKTISAVLDGEAVGMNHVINKDATFKLSTWDDPEGKYTFWHSSAHIMAEAIQHYFPNVKLAYGPPVEKGFYYDMDLGDDHFSSNDFERIENDLPLRFAEFGTVYRYEQHGELHGLTRVRAFTQDDAHLFCRPDQLKEEFIKVIDLVLYIFSTLEFENFKAQVSLRDPNKPEKYIGDPALWDQAENAIREAAAEQGLKTIEVEGEAAFYGPKLDFMVRDALDREWQLGTIQVDYNLPERFELEYVGSDNQPHRPVMIHRAPFGSMERFIAVLLEHTGGDLPLWLALDQAAILPISDRFNNYSEKVLSELKISDIRGFVDDRSEKVNRKVRDAEVKKVPYMLVVGEKEEADGTVSVRKHKEGNLGTMTIQEFVQLVEDEVVQSLKLN